MKRLVTFVLIVCLLLTAVFTLSGCAKRGVCDGCEQTEKLEKYVDTDGEVYWYCDDCMSWAKLFR